MRGVVFCTLLTSVFLAGCAHTTILIPDRYLQDCHETAPLTISEYLALGSFEEKEKSLFGQNNLLRGDIKECNGRLKAARYIQDEAKTKIKK